MSATPGPCSGRRRAAKRHAVVVPAGNTVSGWPSSATAGPPSPGSVRTRLRAGLSGSSTQVSLHPAGASHAATCSATPSCSVPPDGESVSTSACSRAQKTSVGGAAAKAPGAYLLVALRFGDGGGARASVRAGEWARRGHLPAEHGLERRRGDRARRGDVRAPAHPKARVIADLEVFRTGADLVLACPPETLDDVLGTLLRARFRKKVALEPAGYALVWGDADGALAELATPIGVERLLAAAPNGDTAPDATWELARIEAGMPRFGHEFTPESMPAEAGLEDRAISFTKGCYPGQEPVARLHYRGHANRGVRGVRFDGAAGRARHPCDRGRSRRGPGDVGRRLAPVRADRPRHPAARGRRRRARRRRRHGAHRGRPALRLAARYFSQAPTSYAAPGVAPMQTSVVGETVDSIFRFTAGPTEIMPPAGTATCSPSSVAVTAPAWTK